MIAPDDRLVRAWEAQLREELDIQRKILAAAEGLTRALVEHQIESVQRLGASEEGLLEVARALRRRRDELAGRSAERLGIDRVALRLDDILQSAGSEAGAGLRQVRLELREVAARLARISDRNQLLARTALGLAGDILAAVTGPAEGDGYRRGGQQVAKIHRAGSLINATC